MMQRQRCKITPSENQEFKWIPIIEFRKEEPNTN